MTHTYRSRNREDTGKKEPTNFRKALAVAACFYSTAKVALEAYTQRFFFIQTLLFYLLLLFFASTFFCFCFYFFCFYLLSMKVRLRLTAALPLEVCISKRERQYMSFTCRSLSIYSLPFLPL